MPSALACLALSAGVGLASPVITVNTYDDSGSISGVWDWYGGSTLTWDGTQDHTGNSGGSLYISKNTSNDHIFDVQSFSGNTWDNGKAYDLTLYTNLAVWIKWDSANSSMNLSDFNANLGGLTMELNDNHLGQYDWSGNGLHALPSVQIPNTASNGWVLLNFPISSSIPYIDTIGSIIFDAYHTVPWSGTVAFWVDDITFQPSAVDIIPPPTLAAPIKANPGLNVIASTEGSLYDRQSARMRQQSGLSWVGNATTANPATYSFTIDGFPNTPNTFGCEAYLFLVPNPNYNDTAPDWNETNVALAFIQQGATSATMYFEYKINDNNNNAMFSGGSQTVTVGNPATSTNNYYYTAAPGSMPNGAITNVVSPGVFNITNEGGTLASLTCPGTALGTWTIKFTSDTSGTLIGPNGASTNFVFPAYNVGNFAEQQSPGFNVYLGMQANNAGTIGHSIDFASFSITNAATQFADDFAADTALDTTNTWDTTVAAGPLGVMLVPATGAYWLQWTLPDTSFSLQVGASLGNLGNWTSPSLYPSIPLVGDKTKLVDSSEIPTGRAAFFNMVKRTATQLQVLLPGETNAPGTATGKTGTPTVESVDGLVTVTVNMVDSTWHLVSSSDSVSLSSSTNPSAGTATGSLVGGTVQITDWYFDTAGSQTITASDTTSTNILSNTSSAVTAQ